MIKIEIIDPCKENPDVLVKTAAYLMELAGHKMIKAPEVGKEVSEIIDEMFNNSNKEKNTLDTVNTLKASVPNEIVNGGTEAPYQNCSESDLTNYTPVNYVPPTFESLAKDVDKAIGKLENSGNLPPLSEKQIDEAAEIMEKELKPKKKKKSNGYISTPPAPIAPLEEIIEPPPITPVNFHMVTRKIVSAIKEGKITQEEINLILGNHGLVQLKDLHTAPHAIEPINKDLDQALRGK